MIYCLIHSFQCYNPANDKCTNTCSRLTSGANWLLRTGFYGIMNDGATKSKVAADVLFFNMTHNSVSEHGHGDTTK
jgi:hypothetical protein